MKQVMKKEKKARYGREKEGSGRERGERDDRDGEERLSFFRLLMCKRVIQSSHSKGEGERERERERETGER